MSYTFLSAQYSDPEHLTATAMTAEAALVFVSAVDHPAEWAALHAWGTPDAYVAPVVVPRSVSPLQARRALRAAGLYGSVVAAVENSTDPDLKDAWEYATAWQRTDPHVLALAARLGLTDEQLDNLFILAATL